jgi:ribokinase
VARLHWETVTTCSVVVVGSLNHDVAIRLARFPRPDETLVAHDVAEFRGGKGYNQATASARLGAAVAMIGCVGEDGAGDLLRAGMQASGIDQTGVHTVPAHTGMAVPLITDDGEVAIVIVAGANALLDAAIVDASAAAFTDADVLLLQGEVPIGASARAAGLARAAGARVVVNPAPVGADSNALVELADLVVVNRDEAASLDLKPSDHVVMTLGAGGVLVRDTHVPAFEVEVVDPTGAGDAFCAALAVALAEGSDLVAAARFGAAAGACAVRRLGAEPGLPTRDEVLNMLGE